MDAATDYERQPTVARQCAGSCSNIKYRGDVTHE